MSASDLRDKGYCARRPGCRIAHPAYDTLPISEKPERLAACPGREARLDLARRDVDDMHRAVALAGDQERVAAKHHVHRLAADLDGGLLAERGIDQAHDVAFEAGDAQQAEVRAVAGDLRGFRHAREPHGF